MREIRRVLELLGRDAEAVAGSNRRLADTRTPAPSRGAELIVREAMRDDTGRDFRVYTWLDVRLMLEDFFLKLSSAA